MNKIILSHSKSPFPTSSLGPKGFEARLFNLSEVGGLKNLGPVEGPERLSVVE
jgi:hypothetical protein